MASRRPRRAATKIDSYEVRLDIGSAGSEESDAPAASKKRKGKQRAISVSSGDESGGEEQSVMIVEDESEEDEIESIRDSTPSSSTRTSPVPTGVLTSAKKAKAAPKTTPKQRRRSSKAGTDAKRFMLDFRLPTWASTLGLIHQPDPSCRLPAPFDDASNFTAEAEPCKEERGIDQTLRSELGKQWVLHWFGLAWHLVEELAYYRRFASPASKPPQSSPLFSSLDQSAVARYLPVQLYPSKTLREANGTAAPDAMDAPERDDEDEDGSMTISMGLPDEIGGAPPLQVRLERFESGRLDSVVPTKPGHLLNAGGPVFGLDWLPVAPTDEPPAYEYLAVSTFSSSRLVSPAAPPAAFDSPGLIQIWALPAQTPSDFGQETSAEADDQMSMALGVCIDTGEVWQLQWRPHGYESREGSLGHLACIVGDASLCIFDIPNPHIVINDSMEESEDIRMVHCKPLLRLTLPDTGVNALEWSSRDRIVACCGNGCIAVWHVSEAIRLGLPTVRPSTYVPTESAALHDLCLIRIPPLSADGEDLLNEEPTMIATCDRAGSYMCVDLRDPASPINYFYERGGSGRLAWLPYLGCLVSGDSDRSVRTISIKPRSFGTCSRTVQHPGSIIDVAANQYSPFVASSSSDGMCVIDNALRHQVKSVPVPIYGRVVYRIDYDRSTGQYRMFDNEIPVVRYVHALGSKVEIRLQPVTGTRGTPLTADAPAAVYPPQTAVQRVAWARHIRRAHLLASGMACGLVRVDSCASGPPERHGDLIWKR